MDDYQRMTAESENQSLRRRVSDLEQQEMLNRFRNSGANTPPPVYVGEATGLDKAVVFFALLFLGIGGCAAVWESREGQEIFREVKALVQRKLQSDGGSAVNWQEASTVYKVQMPEAIKLSKTPASQLYVRYLKAAPVNWASMRQGERLAVKAAWLRYTERPEAFKALDPAQRVFYLRSFSSMLSAMEAEGFERAKGDRLAIEEALSW